MKGKIELSHAKMARPFVHAPGLFRSYSRGEQKKLKLDIDYRMGDAEFKFWGPEPLGVMDLRVLQGLVALATGQVPARDGVKDLLDCGHLTREGLELRQDAVKQHTIGVKFKLYAFAQALGYVCPGAATLAALRKSIMRLSAVTILALKPGFRGSYHIVSGYGEDTETGDVSVGLNPELTAAVLGGKNGHLKINLAEVRRLDTDVARLIHSRLHWINEGKEGVVGLATLIEYAYPEAVGETGVEATTLRKRRYTVRKAMNELRKIGWEHSIDVAGNYKIVRTGNLLLV